MEELQLIVHWISTVVKAGIPIIELELLNNLQHLITELKRINPFTDGHPGQWYKSFLRHNPLVWESCLELNS